MKKTALCFALLLTTTSSRAAEPAAADRELLEVRRSAWVAWFGGDRKTLEALLPVDALVVSSDSPTWTSRAETAAQSEKFHAGGGKLVKLDFPTTEVRHYGDSALVFSTYRFEVESEGKTSSQEGKAIEVFVREGGRWIHPTWTLIRTPAAK